MTTNYCFHPSLLLLFLDPGSGMDKNQDPGSGIVIPDPQHCFKVLLSLFFDLAYKESIIEAHAQ
jgi:hypothetical protein